VQCIFNTIYGSIASHGAADRESLIDDQDGDIDNFAKGAKRQGRPNGGLSLNDRFALKNSGAGEGIRTLDPDLGKVVLYH
jgi:hypothetical protein